MKDEKIGACASCLESDVPLVESTNPAPSRISGGSKSRWVCELCSCTFACSAMWWPGQYDSAMHKTVVHATRYLERRMEAMIEDLALRLDVPKEGNDKIQKKTNSN